MRVVKENMNSSIFKLSLRSSILLLICLQNAGYTLLRKYSTQTEMVSATEILFVGEVIKMAFAIWATITDTEISDAQGQGVNKLMWLIKHSGKMLVLAGIYGAMNILSFVALQYIGAGEFTICAQLKILSTAGFSVLIMKTALSWVKWRALGLLVLGCILVASPSFRESQEKANGAILQSFGYGAVLTEVCLSGFASIYFEKVVKSTTEVVTIWERNFQLGFYSLLLYGSIIVYENCNAATTNSLMPTRTAWSNWSMLTLSVSVFGAAGGLLVAATLKYADSILKTMATAGAIVISTVLGHFFLNGPFDMNTCIGGMVTITAILNYTLDMSTSNGSANSVVTKENESSKH